MGIEGTAAEKKSTEAKMKHIFAWAKVDELCRT